MSASALLSERDNGAQASNPADGADKLGLQPHATQGGRDFREGKGPSLLENCSQPRKGTQLLREAYSVVKIATLPWESKQAVVTDTTVFYVATVPHRQTTVARDSVVVPCRAFVSCEEVKRGEELSAIRSEALSQEKPEPRHRSPTAKPVVPRVMISQPSAIDETFLKLELRERATGVDADMQAVARNHESCMEARPTPVFNHHNRPHGGYLPIQDYGVVGNLNTVALCGIDGSIDFMCYPRFDSPTIFGRMLDARKGGFFQVSPTEPCSSKQLYLPNSNVLLTRFLAEGGVGQTTDFMPVMNRKANPRRLPWLMRKVEVVRGELKFRIDCFPSFDYCRVGHTTHIWGLEGEDENNSDGERSSGEESFPSLPQCEGKESSVHGTFKLGDSVVFFTSNPMRTTCTKGDNHENREEVVADQVDGEMLYRDMPMNVRNGSSQRAPSTSYPPQEHSFRMSMDLRYATCAEDSAYLPVVCWDIPESHHGAAGSRASGPGVSCTVTLSEGQSVYFVLREIPPMDLPPRQLELLDPPLTRCLLEGLLEDTIKYWRAWADNCSYKGRWREDVVRSALALKLMTYEDTGAMVAAPTFGLPEGFGGERNWDYRYTWIRDAAFTVYAFIRIGFTEEAHGFMAWIERRCREMGEMQERPLQIMYGIDGQHKLTEEILSHLEGYRSSRPVRVGNGAYNQLQLDIYGELMDSVYLLNKYGSPIGYDLWLILVKLVDYVCDHYHMKDEGIWEVRAAPQHFVYSKVMSWVAIDRGLRLADKRSFPAPRKKWYLARDTIYTEIMEKGWSHKLKAFKQAYDNESLDAANLIMPLCFFISPSDPRLYWTLEATLKPPHRGGLVANNLCFRYNVETSADSLTGEEGTFSICSFWLVEALTRSGRYHKPHLEQALTMFEQMIGYGNHLGLFSEQIAKTGEGMGNFPQAFTHLALISAAFNLDRVLG